VLSTESDVYSFTICFLSSPTNFQLIYPSDGQVDVDNTLVTFSWDASFSTVILSSSSFLASIIDSYTPPVFDFDTDIFFSSSLFTLSSFYFFFFFFSFSNLKSSCATSDISYKLFISVDNSAFSLNYTGPNTNHSTSLSPGVYRWRVEAIDSKGSITSSLTSTFFTLSAICEDLHPEPPIVNSPSFSVDALAPSNLTVFFSWSPPDFGVSCASKRKRGSSGDFLTLNITTKPENNLMLSQQLVLSFF